MKTVKDIIYDKEVTLEDIIAKSFYDEAGNKLPEVECMDDFDIRETIEEISQNITLYQIEKYKEKR